MTTYVIGDIQGCFPAFKRLLKKVAFDPGKDCLWSVGDLVNRGPDNLSTLRWFYQHRDSAVAVLGNHDLHLIAAHRGKGRLSRSDNIGDILKAPDADELVDWLRHRPLMHRDENDLMTHAGIPPCWSALEAATYATEVEAALQGPQCDHYLGAMYGNEPWTWSPHLQGLARLRVITNYFTRMRYCTPTGGLDFKSKGATPEKKKLNGQPVAAWFKQANKLAPEERVFFGHWASLGGETDDPQFIGLDTGCVWGGVLTLINRKTGERYHAKNAAKKREVAKAR